MAGDPSATALYEGRYLTLQCRDGWEFVHRRHPVVVIVAWTPDDELLLVEQFRVPLARRTIELPAGLVGDDQAHGNEDIFDAAARELEEETGWRAGRLEEIMSCPISAGLTDESVLFVRATTLEQVGRGGGDESEDIVVHRIRRSVIDEWLSERYANGLAIDPKIFAALYWSING